MKNFTPLGHKIEYLGKRHWYEILPEIMDMLFGVSVIVGLFWSLSWLLYEPKFLIGFLLAVFPIFHLAVELIEWSHELYAVTRDPDGDGWIFKRKGWLGHYTIAEDASDVSIIQKTPLLGRILGFSRIELRSAKHTFIEGRLVPMAFVDAVFDAQVSGMEVDEDDPQTFLLANIDKWVARGLVDVNQAKHFLAKQLA